MSRPRARCAGGELGWALRLPFMLAVAAFVSCLLSAIERPPTRARSGPEAVRVQGVEPAVVAQLQSGLTDLDRRLARLHRSLERSEGRAWAEAVMHFDDQLRGWESWPLLRLGGDVELDPKGACLRAWPDTSAIGFGLAGLDPAIEPEVVADRLERARESVRGLAGALAERD